MTATVHGIRVLVVADDPLARAGLVALLTGREEYNVVGQLSGEADQLAMSGIYQPEVVLWDLGWEPAPILESLSDLAETLPPVLALLPDGAHAAGAWAAGARGLLRRDSDPEELAVALGAVARGLAVLDPELASALVQPRAHAPEPLSEDLTPREREVLLLLAEGLPNKSIAYRLNISEHTVKFHVNAILGKLGAQSRTEAVTRATRLGLVIL